MADISRAAAADRAAADSSGGLDAADQVTVAIPTYGREETLVETIRHVLRVAPEGIDLVLADQTERHAAGVAQALEDLEQDGKIRLLRLPAPSIPVAMNAALESARTPYVLFLDDDIIPDPGLIEAHLDAQRRTGAALVAGRVVQPWQEGVDFSGDRRFHVASLRGAWPDYFIGANFLIDRRVALEIGGFDENFVRVAHRYENELAHRLRRAGHRIYFEPAACIHHLKEPSGGTRSFGEHLRTLKPDHSVGEYYFILRTRRGLRRLGGLLWRPVRAVRTRHHLRRPWWIPLTLIGEARGLLWALGLAAGGPRYLAAVQMENPRD